MIVFFMIFSSILKEQKLIKVAGDVYLTQIDRISKGDIQFEPICFFFKIKLIFNLRFTNYS
jgi:hypothetical protein